ncbi:scarecrow-like protein 8 [Tanacetum coccineum]|uniref:Scarecrow-like protein 8 n=1 Tax=Tanacetum coccineum TaxID=301880 RepID=A0ABQ5IN54_9ASTR
MSSGYPNGHQDYYNNIINGRSMSTYRSPLAGILSDQRPDLIGKRSLAEFQHHQQQQMLLQQQASFYLRNVKPRPYTHNNNLANFSISPTLSSVSSMTSSSGLSNVPRYGVPVMQNYNNLGGMGNNYQNTLRSNGYLLPAPVTEQALVTNNNENNNHMMKQLQELEKQLLTEAAGAITDGKQDTASEILTRVSKYLNARGTPEQRLCFYITTALKTRMNVNEPKTTSDLYGKDHILSTQLLYDKSPCFKLGFMAANNAILEAGNRIHVLDFDIGNGVQYVYLLNEIAAAREARGDDIQTPFMLKLTTIADFGNGGVERLDLVGDNLKSLANKLGVTFSYNVLNLKLCEINTTSLAVKNDEVLVVNFAFKLFRLPDESVTTENLRDEVLRRVKGLSPALVTVVEQELNGNTASFETRVSQACGYYLALLESLDATIGRDHPDRVKIDEGLSRKIINSVACEGRDRVERCEVFGKWRVRMSMAGFKPKAPSQLGGNVNSVTRGNSGFVVKEESGGISLGWMGRTLTVASAWH